MSISLKISKFLEIQALKIRSYSLYFELKYYLKRNKTYLKDIYPWQRAIGKTYTLVKLAHKFKCPIIVNSYSSVEHILNMCKNFKYKDVEVLYFKELRGKKYDKVLIEEGLTYKTIFQDIKPCCNCVVGYININ